MALLHDPARLLEHRLSTGQIFFRPPAADGFASHPEYQKALSLNDLCQMYPTVPRQTIINTIHNYNLQEIIQ